MSFPTDRDRAEDKERQNVRAALLASEIRGVLENDAYDSPEVDQYALHKAVTAALLASGLRLERP